MLFNSYAFLIFLPCVLLLYWLAARRLAWQNALLVLASYVFYAWWDVRFLALILGMTAVGFAGGRLMCGARRQPQRERAVCVATVVVCIGVLGWFKYYGFFAENLARLLGAFGLRAELPTLRIILPVGISFYTFQILSYVIDVYRHRIPACRDAVAFAAFVSFFPQLVAGPIEKAQHLLPQMQAPRSVGYAQVVDGLRLMLWGFVKKMLLADRVLPSYRPSMPIRRAMAPTSSWAPCSSPSRFTATSRAIPTLPLARHASSASASRATSPFPISPPTYPPSGDAGTSR